MLQLHLQLVSRRGDRAGDRRLNERVARLDEFFRLVTAMLQKTPMRESGCISGKTCMEGHRFEVGKAQLTAGPHCAVVMES